MQNSKLLLLLAAHFFADCQAKIGSRVSLRCNTCGGVIEGVWGQWGPWSSCTSVTSTISSQSRRRSCSAASCPGGDAEEARRCAQYNPPASSQPQWTTWGSWGQCSVTCGTGVCTRRRTCATKCACGCAGSSSEQKPCLLPACPLTCSACQQTPPPSCNTCGGGSLGGFASPDSYGNRGKK